MNLEQKIEALLFYKNEPVRKDWLASVLEVEKEEVAKALENLSASLAERGIALIDNKIEVSLVTAPGMKDLIEKIAKDEMKSEIGKAGLETLAIILYNEGATRREIDYIRGVNSSYVLRNLAMRGLIEKDYDKGGQKTVKYKTTLSLLAHLGLKKVEELPDFLAFKNNVAESLKDNQDEQI